MTHIHDCTCSMFSSSRAHTHTHTQGAKPMVTSPPVFRCDYNVYSTFQSHEPEFDYLKSLEIEEKINQICWVKQSGSSLFLLTTNGALYGVVRQSVGVRMLVCGGATDHLVSRFLYIFTVVTWPHTVALMQYYSCHSYPFDLWLTNCSQPLVAGLLYTAMINTQLQGSV